MSRPVALSAMSGNFDFPPATNYPIPVTTADDEDEDEDDSDFENFIQGLTHFARESTMEQNRPSTSSDSVRRYRRQSTVREEIRRRHAERASQMSDILNSDVQAPTSALRSRPQAIPVSRQIRRHIQRHHESQGFPGSARTIQQAVDRVNEADRTPSSLLDRPIPRLGSPDMTAREYSGEAEVNRRRAKRRKLDNDPLSVKYKGFFLYGYRGQVVPGRLRMEIVRCDGGPHSDAARYGREYCAENVLRDDKSVYCTPSSRCNIFLRHQGETSFCLSKLVIKAPERGFTAPIQEGLVFISMNFEDLSTRTTRYQVRDVSPPEAHSPDYQPQGRQSTLRPSRSEEPNENRPPSRRTDDTVGRSIPPPISDSRAYPMDFPLNPYPLVDLGDDSTPSPQTAVSPNSLAFNVTTDCDDHSGDEEEESSAAILADRHRRDHLVSLDLFSDSDTEDGDSTFYRAHRTRTSRFPASQHGSRRRANPSRLEIAAPSTPDHENSQNQKPNLDILVPHARFFIDVHKSMVSIKFDPPVSGRFILLKLWSPAKDTNIDIQSIVVHGFAGPRFFPAVQMM